MKVLLSVATVLLFSLGICLVARADERYPRVVYFSATWCAPCQAALHGRDNFPDWLRPTGWQIDESTRAHIQLVDFDHRQDLVQVYNITRIPAMVLVTGPDKFSKPVIYNGKDSIVRMFQTK